MTLLQLIDLHRELYRADLSIERLVSRTPPTSMDPNTGELHEEPAARTGMAMSGRLLRYLGHPEAHAQAFPWSFGLWRMKGRCRRAHPQHRSIDRPYWRGSLCWSLAMFVIVRGYSLDNAALILQVDRDVEQTLTTALHLIEDAIDEQRARAERRAREDAGMGPGPIHSEPVHERHDMGGLHQSDCGKCRRAA